MLKIPCWHALQFCVCPCSLSHKHLIQHVCAMHACIAGLHAICQGHATQLRQAGRRHACITALEARLTRNARLRTRMQCSSSSSSSSRQAACITPAASRACGSFAGGSSPLMPTVNFAVSSRPTVPTLNFAARRPTCPESSDVQDSLSSSSMRSGILGEYTL